MSDNNLLLHDRIQHKSAGLARRGHRLLAVAVPELELHMAATAYGGFVRARVGQSPRVMFLECHHGPVPVVPSTKLDRVKYLTTEDDDG